MTDGKDLVRLEALNSGLRNGDDCDRLSDDDVMRACAEACRRCAESCERMATAAV